MEFKKKLNVPLIIAILFLAFFFFFQYGINVPFDKKNRQEILFSVDSGESLLAVSKNLKKNNLIKNKIFFIFYVLSKKSATSVRAGEYLFNQGMSIREIAEKLIGGAVVKIMVTIPEGYNIREIQKKINFQFSLLQEATPRRVLSNFHFPIDYQLLNFKIKDFQNNSYSFLMDARKDATLEGFLFPDTYNFSFNATIKDMINTMLDNFDKKLTPDLRKEIKKEKKTIYEIITMASLIEKEVRTEKDMKLVSGILWKRLEIGMPLQVDAAIVYFTGKKTGEIIYDDLKIDSPYNTYLYKGLPRGPISNPGIQAIKAVIYPENSDYLFYLSKPDGETIFSKTPMEHNIAKQKYLK